ncbi:MAG: hypothetical protein II630_09545 [Bacteroidales bacterium]|nr:hypothetical protein [Bacteroidales bacterium]
MSLKEMEVSARGINLVCAKTYPESIDTCIGDGIRYHLLNGESITMSGKHIPDAETKLMFGTDIYGKEVFVNVENVGWFERVTIRIDHFKYVNKDGRVTARYTTYVLPKDEEIRSDDDRAEEYRLPLIETIYSVEDDGTEVFLKRILN